MLTQWIRLIKDTTDLSLDNQGGGGVAMDGGSTYYIGKKAPFNNFFMQFGTANINSVAMTVSYWSGSEWVEAVDLLDGTVGASQSGVTQFSPHRTNLWKKTQDTSESGAPTELSTFTIYDMYWLKVEFSGDLSADTELTTLSYKFTDSAEMLRRDVDINEFLTAFGQNDWLPQIMSASTDVAIDLKRKNLITDEGQLLRFDDVAIPTAYRAIFLVYLNLGEDYTDRRKEILKLYNESLAGIYSLDKNSDGHLSSSEMEISSGRFYR